MFAGASPVKGSARGASVVQLRTAIGARLQGTTLVHTSQSGERQVIDFIGVAGAARQSLLRSELNKMSALAAARATHTLRRRSQHASGTQDLADTAAKQQ